MGQLHQPPPNLRGSRHRLQLDEINVAGGNRNWFPDFQHRFEVQFNGFANIVLGLLESRSRRDSTRQVRNIGSPIGFSLFEDNGISSHDSLNSAFLRVSAETLRTPAAGVRDQPNAAGFSQKRPVCLHGGADPQVRGRRPRRPARTLQETDIVIRAGGTGASRADQGSTPPCGIGRGCDN